MELCFKNTHRCSKVKIKKDEWHKKKEQNKPNNSQISHKNNNHTHEVANTNSYL